MRYGVNFAGKNGLPYVSVFKVLRDKGVDRKYLSFAGLKQYFQDFPDDMWPTLVTNPSYTFFALSDEPPCGAARVYLTGGHSLAVDTSRLPLGMAAFFQAERPAAPKKGRRATSVPFARFALAQDTGGAIQGAHVDVYWGTGDYAQLASDTMNSQGQLFYMKLK
jgi:membrane-bound lytic murein transglycosylase A